MNCKTTMTMDSIDSQTPRVNGGPRMMNKDSFIMSTNNQTVTIENRLLSASDVETRCPLRSTSTNDLQSDQLTDHSHSQYQ